MRKYSITRRSIVTTATVKAVNLNTFEVVDMTAVLEGAFANTADALKAVQKVWENDEFNPVAVTAMACKVKTYGMTAAQWFEHADVIEENDITPEEAAQFGKRQKKSDENAQ
nr:MAG TPA: hypothetical protein [Caudoviricetes sp.]